MTCASVTRKQAIRLLEVARDNAREVSAKRLGAVGAILFPSWAYAVVSGEVSFGTEMPARGEDYFHSACLVHESSFAGLSLMRL